MSKYIRRKKLISYLVNFFMGLPHDFPVKHKMSAKVWAENFFEELSEEDKQNLYNKIK